MSDASWQFGALHLIAYDMIIVDFPRDFTLYSKAGEKKFARSQYATVSVLAIAALRLGNLARGDCLLLRCCEWIPPGLRQWLLGAGASPIRPAW